MCADVILGYDFLPDSYAMKDVVPNNVKATLAHLN